ncbi:MAG TPA: glycerol-3-phosphate 1-O-acyltransferase PlsY [Thermoanaerobaculia bacterium]|nr:glycerol-3-phosphate 1-O-acyltransferase PlsY [Thermoanaerobaculia bacterium]HUM30820.1 glycerol-3-phosphate 1-O-acyltransferase PlsY [Thermoanaerobaculia bacterium]HXK69155.1 glycerol-3-phosphate 1-O-acyltransferase PlsY [Thermoanaerobaculia bacterium]
MPEAWWYVLVAYLLGSIPFGYLLTFVISREDIRSHGSGNIGATNVSRKLGLAGGLATLALDAGKGALAVWIPIHFSGHPLLIGASVFAVVAGHCYPIFLAFKGGKGVATAAGAFIVLAPLPTLLAALVLVITVLIKRYVSLGSCVGAAVLPILMALLNPPHRWVLLFTVLTACLIIYRHRENIQRIQDGTERRFPERKKP